MASISDPAYSAGFTERMFELDQLKDQGKCIVYTPQGKKPLNANVSSANYLHPALPSNAQQRALFMLWHRFHLQASKTLLLKLSAGRYSALTAAAVKPAATNAVSVNYLSGAGTPPNTPI